MKNNKSKSINKIIEQIKSDPQKKAWIVLVGYFLFFFLVVILVRAGNNQNKYQETFESSKYFDIENILNEPYYFKYSINLDEIKTIYEGNQEKNTSNFTKTSQDTIEKFYQSNNTFYLKQENNFKPLANPYILPYFRDISNLEKILENAKLISKTEYENKNRSYDYQVSTTTLVKLIDNLDIDIADMPNIITVTTNKNKEISNIKYELTPYTIYKNLAKNKGTIEIEYTLLSKTETTTES